MFKFNAIQIAIVFCIIILVGCFQDKGKNIPSVNHIEVDIKIHRFEQDLFKIDTNDIASGLKNLEEKYPEFSDFYLKRILQIKKPWDTTGVYKTHIKGFLTYPFVQHLQDTVQIIYKDLNPIKQKLKKGFQFYKYYFPEREIPEFYTFISEFSFAIIFPPIEHTMAIGLDFFLGKDYPYYAYPPLSLPKYIARTQDKEHLPAKIFDGLISDMLGELKGTKFIDHIIHNGKKLYLLDHLLPFEPDSIKLGYTALQTDWCTKNEKEMWAYFLKEELLYSDDFQKFKTIVSTSPHSAGMPPEAPGQAGNWMGWQIVKAYMKQHPELTPNDLVKMEVDGQQVLAESKYRPPR